MENRLGYACICMGINENKSSRDKISVNRGMVRKTFESKGLKYVSELIKLNLLDFRKILDYNLKNNILVYRMSSEMFPWFTEYELEELPNFAWIDKFLKNLGDFIRKNDIRVSFHPGPFCVLSSQTESVVQKTISELDKHSKIMDLMCLDKNHYYPINIHVSTAKPTKKEACDRFIENFKKLSESTKRRLTIENDDKSSLYSVKDLYELLYKEINIPIVFDQHHYHYGPKDLSLEESLDLALSTWGDIKPLTHMSSSKKIEDDKSKETAHADFIYERIITNNKPFDIEIEAKSKDLAVIKYKKDFL